jgi:CubicO group peptidase (beta-lactamase class C family)
MLSKRNLLCATAAIVTALAAAPLRADSVGKSQPTLLGFSTEGLGRITDFFKAEVAAGRVPGVIMLIERHGKPAYFETFGVRDVATKVPMSPDTLFRIYSMSKPLTSLAAIMLVQDGKLSLADPLSKYIPSFAKSQVGVETKGADGQPMLQLVAAAKPITIQDLMRHTSGITYSFSGHGLVNKQYADQHFFDNELSNEEFAERVASLPLAFQPGTTWDYSHSTDVLGRVIEVVSGKSLYAFMKERILDPMGMTHTSFYVTDPRQQPLIAEPLHDDGGSGASAMFNPRIEKKWQSGGGGVVSTISDYSRFAQMILNGGVLDGKRYLMPKIFTWMTSSHTGPGTGIVPGPAYLPGAGFDFGLGFAVRMQPGAYALPGSVGELNWGGAGGTYFWVDPKEDMYVIMMMQSYAQRVPYRNEIKNLVYSAMEK